MPLLYAQLIRAAPLEYGAAGRSLGQAATQLQRLGDRLAGHGQELSSKAMWRGSAQVAAATHNTACLTDLQEIGGALASAAEALAFAAESIQPAALVATETGVEAETTGFIVTALGAVLVSPAQYAEANAAGPEAAPELILAFEEGAAVLTEIIDTAVGEASAADSAAAEALQASLPPLRAIGERPLNLTGPSTGPGLRWEPSKKHGSTQRGKAAPEPTHPEQTLANSVPLGDNTPRRVAVDPETGEYCVFDETYVGKRIYHGHVRPWSSTGDNGPDPLNQQMQNALIRAGLVDRNGRIL